MPDYSPRRRARRDDDDYEPPVRIGTDITVPQCKICMHPQRFAIDRIIALRTMSDGEISRLYNEEFSRSSVQRHRSEHLNYNEAAIKAIVDRQIDQMAENEDIGVSGLVARRIYLEMVLQRGIEAMANGDITPEVKDVLGVIAQQNTMDEDNAAVKELELIRTQFNAFRQAISEIAGQDMGAEILARTREILTNDGSDQPSLPSG